MTVQTTILINAILTALNLSLLGNFVILRKLAMTADGVSHALLPGIVMAYLIFGSLDSPFFVVFALLSGILMIFLVDFLKRHDRVFGEAALGVSFTAFFALGVIMVVTFADRVHIDAHAVLYGMIEFSGFDLKNSYWLLGMMLLNLIFLGIFYKEMKLTTFDEALALNLGLPVKMLRWGFLLILALNLIVAFEAVGAILVLSLLVTAPAGGIYLAKGLWRMILWSLVLAFFAAVAGFFLAFELGVSVSAMIAVMAGLELFVITLFRRKK